MPEPTPLRTPRATFTAWGSSRFKPEVFCSTEPVVYASASLPLLSTLRPTSSLLVFSQFCLVLYYRLLGSAFTPFGVIFCLLPFCRFFRSFAINDHVKVCLLSHRLMLPYCRRKPYPGHYSPAFAFFTFLYPHSHQLALRLAFPKGEVRAYRVPFFFTR